MKNHTAMTSNDVNALPMVVKDAKVVPAEVSVNTIMPKGMAEALAAANATTKDLIHTALDRFAATSPEVAAKIGRVTVVQTFTVVPDTVRLDIEVK